MVGEGGLTYEEAGTETVGTGGPDWPDNLGNNLVPGIPRRVILALSNPRLDPLESLDVAPPVVMTNTNATTEEEIIEDSNGTEVIEEIVTTGNQSNSVAVMSIVDFYNAPVNQAANTPCTCTNYSVYNFERRTFRTWKPQGAGNSRTVTLWVYRENPQNYAVTLNWSIDASGTQNGVERASELSGLEAASDNAILSIGANGTDYDVGSNVTGSITFPANKAGPEGIPITIYNNGAVEFDMEFSISLSFAQNGGATSEDVIGSVGTATCVVEFDNATAEQQPGGAVDVTWNPDWEETNPYDIYYGEILWLGGYPEYNTLPGADQEVLAMAIQPDGSAIFGGGFHAYDATNFNYLVRTSPNGLPDFSFAAGPGFIGPNDVVTRIAIDGNGKVIIGGHFMPVGSESDSPYFRPWPCWPPFPWGPVRPSTASRQRLFIISKFVTWPAKAFAAADSPLVIGVLGQDPFGAALDDAVADKSIDTHPIKIKRFKSFDPAAAGALKKCHVLFICLSEKDHVPDIIQALNGASVLTVSEAEDFPKKGGALLLGMSGSKLSLLVNQSAAKSAGLVISSKLLQVCKIYDGE